MGRVVPEVDARLYCGIRLAGQRSAKPNPDGDRVVTKEDIERQVIEIVGEQMGVDKSEITRETNFMTDLNADSLDTVELVMEFEDRFETSIPDDKAEQIKTIGDAIDHIFEAKSAAKT